MKMASSRCVLHLSLLLAALALHSPTVEDDKDILAKHKGVAFAKLSSPVLHQGLHKKRNGSTLLEIVQQKKAKKTKKKTQQRKQKPEVSRQAKMAEKKQQREVTLESKKGEKKKTAPKKSKKSLRNTSSHAARPAAHASIGRVSLADSLAEASDDSWENASSWSEAVAAFALDARDILLGLPVSEGFQGATQLSSSMASVRRQNGEALFQGGDFTLSAEANATAAMKLMFDKTTCVTDHVVNEIGCVADCECRWFMQCYPYNLQVNEVQKAAYKVNVGVCELAITTMFAVSTLTFICWIATFLCLFRKLRDETGSTSRS